VGFKKSGFFKRGLLGTRFFLGSGAFLSAGLAMVEVALGAEAAFVVFDFIPVAFLAGFVLAAAALADGATFGFLGITVNSSSFPQ
jgi:hypothetical protein